MFKRVLVACEYSGVVRRAFEARGFDVLSCDLLPADDNSPYHYQGDVRDLLAEAGKFDLMIAHPPCTDLSVSGVRWLRDHFVKKKTGEQTHKGYKGYWHDGAAKRAAQVKAIEFVLELAEADTPHIAIENPISMVSSLWRKPDQIIQPWMFGHGEVKATCLWLKNLPPLKPTNIVSGRVPRVHMLPPSVDRWKLRSTTYTGIAEAMALQWGPYV